MSASLFLTVNKVKLKLALSFLLTLLIITALLPLTVSADDNRYVEIRKVLIDAEVLGDGSIVVEEQRTYYFGGGEFRGADQWFYFSGDIGYDEIYLMEGGNYYNYVDTFPTTEPGTFAIENHSDYFILDYSFHAFEEEKTFTIFYILQDAVTVHDDVAEIYHKFIGDEWIQSTRYALVTLKLPEGAVKEDIRAWGHGPLHGEVTIESPEVITWEIDDLSPGRFLEVRTTFPPELVPAATKKSGTAMLDKILEEEEKWAAQANLERNIHRLQWFLAPLMFIFIMVFSIAAFRKNKSGTNAYKGDYYRELPGEYPPAVAGYLVRHAKTKTEDFTANIMDLARRKYIRIEEVTTKKGLLKREATDYLVIKLKDYQDIEPHSRKLMDFLFKQVAPSSDWKNKVTRKEFSRESESAEEKGLTFDDIKNYSKKNQYTSKSFFDGWKSDVQTETQGYGLFEKGISKLQIWGIVIGILFFVGLFPLVIFTQFYLIGIILGISGVLMIILMAAAGKPFTEKGADHASKWKAFKKFLLHFSSMDQSTIPSLIVWEHYLVYAVSMGVAKEVMKQLKVVFPDLEEQSRRMGTSWYTMGALGAGGLSGGFDRMTGSFNSVMRDSYRAAFKSSSSSGSGGGGGFSSGGGGGSGGGGRSFR